MYSALKEFLYLIFPIWINSDFCVVLGRRDLKLDVESPTIHTHVWMKRKKNYKWLKPSHLIDSGPEFLRENHSNLP